MRTDVIGNGSNGNKQNNSHKGARITTTLLRLKPSWSKNNCIALQPYNLRSLRRRTKSRQRTGLSVNRGEFPAERTHQGFESNDVLRGVANEKETRDEVPQPCRLETGANSAEGDPREEESGESCSTKTTSPRHSDFYGCRAAKVSPAGRR